jgi:hypothetical protein
MPPRNDGKERAKPIRKPIFVILQILDDSGDAIDFDKNNVKLVMGSANTEKVLNALENIPHAFYKKVAIET